MEEYFDEQIAPLDPQEVFVDGGAYTGDTVVRFLQATEGQFRAIYSFEPDTISFAKLKEYVDSLSDPRIHIYPFGIGGSRGSIKFSNQGTLGSKASETAETTVEIVDLDSTLIDVRPTLVKLDIEGYELDALNGMRHIIIEQAPKLAVCIYHKPADLWQLPLFLKEMVPEYRLFIRHYSPFLYDTVCYAVKV
jgi:FkbM family methyltransferase